VRYDDTGSYKKPVLKYGNAEYEKAPIQSFQEKPSSIGKAITVGDFNCNGKPDLAIGLPDVTYNAAPYYNHFSKTGVVKIVYDYVDDANSTINLTSLSQTGNVQYLSFRDLPSYAYFGKTLSAGNINKDITLRGTNYFSCDDLIIGAPGGANQVGSDNFTGAAYIFYGHPQKFPQPLDSSGLSANAPTCTGNYDSQVCAPVRLSPDVTKWLKVDGRYSSQATATNVATGGVNGFLGDSRSSFGHQVSYIRDFNADGYGDIAVSDPYCDMDGEVQPGFVSTSPGGTRWMLQGVGCVYVYWGGSGGLQLVNMGKTPEYDNTSTDLISPFAVIYPPVPQAGMHFGWSISGGGDVNGAPPVPVKMNGTNKLILANGNDFIVGAPDFNYDPITSRGIGQTADQFDNSMGTNQFLKWTIKEDFNGYDPTSGNSPVDPVVLQGPSNFTDQVNSPSSKMTAGAPYPAQTNLKNSSGIAFLYLGRQPLKAYSVSLKSGFNKFPNLLTDTINFDQLSLNLFDRQNGSQSIEWDSNNLTYDWQYNPKTSFYNCGSRGNARGANNGLYKGISCLAGRNNVSWIYPALKTTDAAVTGFGKSVTIAGSKEQNLIALYELGNSAGATGYSLDDNGVITARSQGIVHESIRGTSLWEVSVKGLNEPGQIDNTVVINSSLTDVLTTTAQTGLLARSALRETYGFNGITALSYFPQTDVNNDGYADVAVGTGSATNNKVFGFYGNYAADFAYHGNENSGTASSCTIADDLSIVPGAITDNPPYKSLSSSLGNDTTKIAESVKPYSTFSAYAQIKNNAKNEIFYRYPYYYYPNGKTIRLSYLDDTTPQSTFSFDYVAVSVNRAANSNSDKAKTACRPLMKTATASVTSLSALLSIGSS